MRVRGPIAVACIASLATTLLLRWLYPFEGTTVDPAAVEGRWVVQEFDGQSVTIGVNTATEPWIEMDEGRIVGNLGCNGFSSDYSVVDYRLALGALDKDGTTCLGDDESHDVMTAERVIGDVFAADARPQIFQEENFLALVRNGHEVLLVSG